MTSATSKAPKPTRLLQSVPATIYERLIMRYPYETDGNFAHAFHEAAMRLASTYKGKPEDDLMLLPFLTLFRQAFELELKELARYLAAQRSKYFESSNADLHHVEVDRRLKDEIGHNLHRLMNEVTIHWNSLKFTERFPATVEKVVLMIHDADRSGTSFRYAKGLPDVEERADFPDLVAMLDEQFRLLGGAYDWAAAGFDAMPEPETYA